MSATVDHTVPLMSALGRIRPFRGDLNERRDFKFAPESGQSASGQFQEFQNRQPYGHIWPEADGLLSGHRAVFRTYVQPAARRPQPTQSRHSQGWHDPKTSSEKDLARGSLLADEPLSERLNPGHQDQRSACNQPKHSRPMKDIGPGRDLPNQGQRSQRYER